MPVIWKISQVRFEEARVQEGLPRLAVIGEAKQRRPRGQTDIHRAIRFNSAQQNAEGGCCPARTPPDGKGETPARPQDTSYLCQRQLRSREVQHPKTNHDCIKALAREGQGLGIAFPERHLWMESAGLDDHLRREVDPDCLSAACRSRRCDVSWASRHVEYLDTLLDTGGIQERLREYRSGGPEGAVVFASCRVPASLLKVAKRARIGDWCCHVWSLCGLTDRR